MKRKRIPTSLRQRVSAKSGWRCGYCLTPQRITGARMVMDHIIPEAAGGLTEEENLWLACHSCNEFKGAQTHSRDPKTGRCVRLFNPRKQRWHDYFTWSEDGTRVCGTHFVWACYCHRFADEPRGDHRWPTAMGQRGLVAPSWKQCPDLKGIETGIETIKN